MKGATAIISDLHLGGGAADPGDDHVYQQGELATFVDELCECERGKRGDLELFINGDFLEFAQANQAAYRGRSSKAWCSEAESLEKLETILQGHAPAFEALSRLMATGSRVTIAPGNHDVDLYWGGVQARLRQATRAELAFEMDGSEWIERYGKALQIAHGHLKDPANTFANWANPFVVDAGDRRLEMCPGTLFMLKFVNKLEARYPFADNLHPVQRLARLLAKDDKRGMFAPAWAFLKIVAAHPVVMARDPDAFGALLVAKVAKNGRFAQALVDVANASGSTAYDSVQALRSELRDEASIAQFVVDYWPQIDASALAGELTATDGASLGNGSGVALGKIAKAADFGKESLRAVAKNRASMVDEARVIVMGHTHVPDDFLATHKARYFNPGSWTRYVDLDMHPGLALEDLEEETSFPFSLKYVWIERDEQGQVTAELKTFREQPARFS
jgi:UDP-2,3-diacylglucosamine pyrophosphatase LpxH